MSAVRPPLDSLPGLPRDADGPVFEYPWQAQTFAMTLSLHEQGLFTWAEWSNALADEIRSAQQAGDPDRGETYYVHWLKALENLVAAKGAASDAELARYRQAWGNAARRTVHGAPIVLGEVDFDA